MKLAPKGINLCPICDKNNELNMDNMPTFKLKEIQHKQKNTKIISIYNPNINKKKLF